MEYCHTGPVSQETPGVGDNDWNLKVNIMLRHCTTCYKVHDLLNVVEILFYVGYVHIICYVMLLYLFVNTSYCYTLHLFNATP